MGKLATIAPQCITSIHSDKKYNVSVLIGAPEQLVTHRELRTKYETNRSIKVWSTWFLLKSITTAGEIKDWRKQRSLILPFLQLNERTFYRHLDELTRLQLITIDDDLTISLVSYKRAAEILDIPYAGTFSVHYNPLQNAGKQIFQYFLRAEEFRTRKEIQLHALMFYLDKNPALKNDILTLLCQAGADEQRLYKDLEYFQDRLLSLQKRLFREGSEILEYVMARRADINRGVHRIKKHHCYRSVQSVSYMKYRMFKLGLINIRKVCIVSDGRSRIHIPDGDKPRDGYKWLKALKQTAWFLTDQITITYETKRDKGRESSEKKAA